MVHACSFARHQFIYAVAFITPVLYFFWERHYTLLTYFLSGKRAIAGLKLTPPGFGVVLIWSVIFFLLTTVSYAIAETRANSATAPTILESGTGFITVIVYMFGMLCWYFMILDGTASPVADYYKEVEQQEEVEKEQGQAFSKRIATNEEEES